MTSWFKTEFRRMVDCRTASERGVALVRFSAEFRAFQLRERAPDKIEMALERLRRRLRP